MKSSNGRPTFRGEDDYAFDNDGQAFAVYGKVRKTARAAGPRIDQGDMDEMARRPHARGQARFDLGDESEPGRKKPEKRAPADQPPGRKPIPEKFPAR